jgi:hypothetical protein
MAKLLYDKIDIETVNGIKINIGLPGRVNLIVGGSSTGKTFAANWLARLMLTGKDTIKRYGLQDNIKVFSSYDDRDNRISIEKLKQMSNRLIIIDDADCILNDEMCCFINMDLFNGNQYLIFTRAVSELRASVGCIGKMYRAGKHIYTEYSNFQAKMGGITKFR